MIVPWVLLNAINSVVETWTRPYISFSHESGFYDEEFELSLDGNGIIYYTLDGSCPNKKSIRYTGPIHIKDATSNPNEYSLRDDVSAGFVLDDELSKRGEKKVANYSVPNKIVDKCTVVRAVCFFKDGSKSDIYTKNYFVGYGNKIGYENLLVVSLVVDPKEMFGEDRGIYVLGQNFDKYKKLKGGIDEIIAKGNDFGWWKANYRMKGSDWERAANVQIFGADVDRKLVMEKEVGIRIAGNNSRGETQKSFKLYARDDYDGNPYFDSTVLGLDENLDIIKLSAFMSDKSKVRNVIGQNIANQLNISTLNHVHSAVFIDGEYWGDYFISDYYDVNWLKNKYNLNTDNVFIYKNGEVFAGEKSDDALYYDMYYWIIGNDMSDAKNYSIACDKLDMNSYIDYIANMVYIGRRGDWPNGNYALWKTKDILNETYADGKFRYMLFDLDKGCFDIKRVDENTVEWLADKNDMFRSLYNNCDFRRQFLTRLLEIGEYTYTDAKINEEIDNYLTNKDAIEKYYSRFYGDYYSGEDFVSEVEEVRQFLLMRKEFITQYANEKLNEQYDTE